MTTEIDRLIELLPCPFCGGTDLITCEDGSPFSIICRGCCVEMPYMSLDDPQSVRWNTRPDQPMLAERDALQSALADTHNERAGLLAERERLPSFQRRVGDWMRACFTPAIIADKLERADRFIEESLELVQATGYSAERAHALVDYVFNRPVGEPFQEVGGVKVTLAALCNPHGIDTDAAAEAELARVWTKIEKIRAKQATKPVGSALPVPLARPHTDRRTAMTDIPDDVVE